jgi:hypothetical protein
MIMDDQGTQQAAVIRLHRTQQYFIGRMLMLRERLAPAPWASFERTAEAICGGILERMPTDHPGSAAWDNRRKRPSGR